MATYDCGVFSMFTSMVGADNVRGMTNEVACVGLLNHIQLDYGNMNTLIVLMQCAWVHNGASADGVANYKKGHG